MKRSIVALLFALASSGAFAQWQVPTNTIPLGRGPGVIGFASTGASATGTKCLLDTTPPSFGICGGGLAVGTTTISGGTSNGILFNNASVLGNLAAGANGQVLLGVTGSPPQMATMSQDCVITNAGIITCTKTNNVAFAPSATTDTTNATNISSGTLANGRYAAVNLAAGNVNGGVVGQLPLANGGCNGTTQQTCLNNTAPTPTRPGDIIYYNGTNWVAVAGNNSGTQVLQENSSGVPSWATVTGTGTVTSVTCGAGLSGGTFTTTGTCAINAIIPPQGRLTLTSATPVMATSVAGATTVYYTPYAGNVIPIYDGTNMVPTAFVEVSQTTTDTTKSPAAVTTNSNYDIFCWVDSGTNRCTRGPVWTNDTSRSAGTALTLVNGIFLNNASITNGPAASRGTYVGTIRTNGSSQVDYIFGAIGAGGVAGSFGVWNAYNRVNVSTVVRDSTDSWTYAVANTWRAPNGSATMRVSFVRGLDEDAIEAKYAGMTSAGAATAAVAGVGLDSTTAFCGTTAASVITSTVSLTAICGPIAGLGFHFVSALELNSTATASTWVGDLGSPLIYQTGLNASLRQ